MVSRFAHFNNPDLGGIIENSHCGSDELLVTAGVGYRSPLPGHCDQGITGSFVSTVLSGNGNQAGVRTSIVKPAPHVGNGGSQVTEYRHQGGDNVIAYVTFSEEDKFIQNSGHGLWPILQGQTPTKIVRYPIPNPEQPFNVRVRNQTGKFYTFRVQKTDSVRHLNQLIQKQTNIQPDEQYLIYGGKKLASNETLGHYGIKEDSEIFLELRLRGG